jgi:hypothetical protein
VSELPSIKTVGKSTLKEIVRSFAVIGKRKSYVKVGIVGNAAKRPAGAGLTMATLATIHEFGAPSRHIPQRSFIRETVRLHHPEYIAMLKQLLPPLYRSETTAKSVLSILGIKAASDIKARVMTGAGVPPPNAPSTLRRKRAKGEWNRRRLSASNAPPEPRALIDTGRMIGSVSYLVVLVDENAEEGTPP